MSREVHVQVLREAGGAIPPADSPRLAKLLERIAAGIQSGKIQVPK
jgi:hypothetical protein